MIQQDDYVPDRIEPEDLHEFIDVPVCPNAQRADEVNQW